MVSTTMEATLDQNRSPATPRAPARPRSLLPKEHGALPQFLFPLGTGLLLAGLSLPALLLALAAAGLFFLHEPALVLLGQRGARAKAEAGARARALVVRLGAVAVVVGPIGFLLAPPAARIACLVSGALAAIVAVLVAKKLERTTAGEVIAALAFASSGIPVALSGGASLAATLTLAGVWAAAYVTATFAVRSVIVRAKRKSALGLVVGATVTGLGACIAAFVLGSVHPLAKDAGWALVPAVLPGVVLAWAPPHPRRLRQIGWTLVGTSFVVAAFAIRIVVVHG